MQRHHGNPLALMIALMALGVKPGDEVLIPSVSFIATAFAPLCMGAKLKFVDIDINTYNVDYDLMLDNITDKTSATIPVHWAGRPLDQGRLREISKKTSVPIVEDGAQAAGAFTEEGPGGSSKNNIIFSFFPTKNLSCMGDGGAILTSSKEDYEKLKLLRNFGRTGREKFSIVGQNSRLDEIQAMILLEKLKSLDAENNKRRELAKLYDKYLNKHLIRPDPASVPGHAYHFYIMLVPSDRDEIQEELTKRGIETTTHYKVPIHEHLINIGFNEFRDLDLRNTEEYSKRCLSLPIYSSLKEEDIYFISKNINALT